MEATDVAVTLQELSALLLTEYPEWFKGQHSFNVHHVCQQCHVYQHVLCSTSQRSSGVQATVLLDD
jgi:hypothetical protein